MSAIEETKTEVRVAKSPAAANESASFITRTLNLLSSVRFGVTLLMLLAAACMIGMLIVQQNVDGFDKYFAALTPAQKFLYGKLGFFDIYHVWYFNGLLLILSLNIVLASIDRFPSAWTYVSRKKLDAGAHWLRGQEQSASLRLKEGACEPAVERIKAAMRSVGLKTTVTEKNGKTFVFGERGVINRLGAYAVHVALLTIFTGGFLTAQFGRTGQMPLEPGTTSDEMTETVFNVDQLSRAVYQIPFQVECTDIEQTLMRKDGTIMSDNTLDWFTRIRITDPDEPKPVDAVVHLNAPYDYRGYRFFQASFIANGKARSVKVAVTPQAGGATEELNIPRNGKAKLSDGTLVEFKDFAANFSVGGEDNASEGTYNNPAATLSVTPPGGKATRAFAFTPEMAERAPFAKQPVAGYTWRLVDFEKAPKAHILSVQKDPGSTVVYVGFTLLALTLAHVFFSSHQRVWALIEEKRKGAYEVVLGGNTNRNQLGFGDRFKKLVAATGGEPFEVKKS
ncbi:MAG TPA: cytochrome c biogenesis protein ResB [Pyrinomonadaceae bacterium]|jgi:cytochrome c biogenesis protein|nr:cytochrome c biogenesis protein ResB [Pyrinomonadaceae bacterium]